MKAARAGHLCTVQFLISKGADVNRTTTNNDHTPLSLACAGGHMSIVELLLQHGADPYHKLKVQTFYPIFLLDNRIRGGGLILCPKQDYPIYISYLFSYDF